MTTDYREAPENLGEAGTRLWDEITATFDFTDEPAKLVVLERAAKTADTIHKLEEYAATTSIETTGSMGQKVINGAFAEIRQQSGQLNNLLKSLKLPETDEESAERATRRSAAGRKAANARHGRNR